MNTRTLTNKQRRDFVRTVHLLLTLPLGAIVFGPPEWVLGLRGVLQYLIFPLLALSGLWLWQGTRLARWLKRASPGTAPERPQSAPRSL